MARIVVFSRSSLLWISAAIIVFWSTTALVAVPPRPVPPRPVPLRPVPLRPVSLRPVSPLPFQHRHQPANSTNPPHVDQSDDSANTDEGNEWAFWKTVVVTICTGGLILILLTMTHFIFLSFHEDRHVSPPPISRPATFCSACDGVGSRWVFLGDTRGSLKTCCGACGGTGRNTEPVSST